MRTFVRLPLLVLAVLASLVLGAVTLPQSATAQQPAAQQPAARFDASALVRTVESTLAAQSTVATEIGAARARDAAAIRQARSAVAVKAAQVRQLRARIVAVARKQIGDRYSAGSSGPNAFDCSGLTRYVYRIAAGKDLPHHSRSQYARAKKISRQHAQPGDLVFFFRNGAHHVGIYIGKGRMIDAPRYGEPVRVSPISGSWWSRTYTGMGRVLPA